MEKEWDKKTWVEEATQNFEEALHEGSFDIAEDVLKDMREIVTKKELQELQSKLTAAKDTFKLEEESLDLV